MTRRRPLLTATVALAVAGLGAVWLLAPAGAVPASAVDAGTLTCTTDSSGFCANQPHSLGVVPVAVLATVKAPASGNPTASQIDADSFTATSFRVRVFKPTGQVFASAQVAYSYAAYAGPAPTTTPPPTTTTPAPTTTAPGGCVFPACFPSAANTGVPAGTALTTVTGDLTVSTAGATVDAKDIQGSLIVQASNVHVTRTRIHGVVFARTSDQSGLLMEDSEITADPGQQYSVGNFPPIGDGNYTLRRVHVHRWQDGPRGGNGTTLIEDSLVDELAFATGEHPDAFQQYGPGDVSRVTLRHDTMSGCAGNSTDLGSSSVFWSDNPGAGSTFTLDQSYLRCGQYTLRINDATTTAGVTVSVSGVRIEQGSWAFGPAECRNSAADSFAAWADVTTTTGVPVTLADCLAQ